MTLMGLLELDFGSLLIVNLRGSAHLLAPTSIEQRHNSFS